MDKKMFRWNDIPAFRGFIVNGKFVHYCEYCCAWHSYIINDDVRDGYSAFRNSKCTKKTSPFRGKIVKIVKIAKVPRKLSLFCPTEDEVRELLDNVQNI